MPDRIVRFISRLGTFAFALYLCLNLTTPSWRYGPFTWIPLYAIPELSGAPVVLGVFNLLPLIIALCWGVSIWHNRQEGKPFNLGQRHLTLPLLAFTIWGVLSLDPSLTRRTFLQGLGLMLGWFVYLYTLNERRDWSRPLLFILISQSLVALGQFFAQHDLGLTALGELPLNPAFSGISVLGARGTRWLRAYGLTTHPNQLGGLLTTLLLILIPGWFARFPAKRAKPEFYVYSIALALGAAALFVSFSRSAWLACLGGLALWGFGQRRQWLSVWQNQRSTRLRQFASVLLILLPAALLFLGYNDLILSRVTNLDQPLEATSVNDRLTAIQLAQKVIRLNWVIGVGLGNYADYARQLDASAFTVHNIPLLMWAELGLPGGLLWLWLVAAPFLPLAHHAADRLTKTKPHQPSALTPHSSLLNPSQLAPWIAMIIIGLFDVTLWLTGHWQTAILFGLLLTHLHYPLTSGELQRGVSPDPL